MKTLKLDSKQTTNTAVIVKVNANSHSLFKRLNATTTQKAKEFGVLL